MICLVNPRPRSNAKIEVISHKNTLRAKTNKKDEESRVRDYIRELEEDKLFLKKQIDQISKPQKLFVSDYYGEKIKIGVISDTHIGSLYSNMELLNMLYKVFKKEKVQSIFHVGDMVDGDGNYREQHYEQNAVGFDAQLEMVLKEYPDIGIKTYFIEGNHAFKRLGGAIIGKNISACRKDLVFLHELEADYVFKSKKGGQVVMRMIHPSGGSSYALSYKPQKIIESYSGGNKPNLLLIGHFHKAFYMPVYRNVFCVSAGTTQRQTPFMKSKGLAAHQGGWILEFYINKKGINQFKAEWIPYYENEQL